MTFQLIKRVRSSTVFYGGSTSLARVCHTCLAKSWKGSRVDVGLGAKLNVAEHKTRCLIEGPRLKAGAWRNTGGIRMSVGANVGSLRGAWYSDGRAVQIRAQTQCVGSLGIPTTLRSIFLVRSAARSRTGDTRDGLRWRWRQWGWRRRVMILGVWTLGGHLDAHQYPRAGSRCKSCFQAGR